MQRIGWTLLLLGGGVLVGYWAYFMVTRVLSEAPLPIRLGIVAVVLGLVVLFATVIRDRLREQKEEEGQF